MTYLWRRHAVSSVVAANDATNTPISAIANSLDSPNDFRKFAAPSTNAPILAPRPLAPPQLS